MSLLAKLYNITLTFKFLLPHWLFINKYLMEFLQRTPPKIQKLYKEMQEWKKHSRQWEWSSNWLPNNLGHWGCSSENWLSNEQWFSQNAALRHLTRPAFQGKIRGRENWKKKEVSKSWAPSLLNTTAFLRGQVAGCGTTPADKDLLTVR